MTGDTFMRRALWTSVFFNVGGGLTFAFPASLQGQLAGLPSAVPGLYRATVAFFVFLFAGGYAWLARQPQIDRPLVAFAAIGKSGFFALMLVFWLVGEAPGRGVIAASGDLILAAIFASWLLGGSPDRTSNS